MSKILFNPRQPDLEEIRRMFPDNATLMVTAMYDLIRCQRNELGHPRETPPSVSKEDAFVNFQIFPRYYETSEVVRGFLSTNSV
jgi:hypothetical protein